MITIWCDAELETCSSHIRAGQSAQKRRRVATQSLNPKELKPDIAILDISMPDLNGLEATRKIRIVSPRTEVLILSMHCSDQLTREVLDTGARGYILKSDSARDLAIAIETLANHKPFFTPECDGSHFERI